MARRQQVNLARGSSPEQIDAANDLWRWRANRVALNGGRVGHRHFTDVLATTIDFERRFAQIPPTLAKVLVARHVFGMTYKETATYVGRSERSMLSWEARALTLLAQTKDASL